MTANEKKQQAAQEWAAAQGRVRDAQTAAGVAEAALSEALAAEGRGGKSALPARQARDEAAHALEAAQAGEAALKADYEAASVEADRETLAATKARYAEVLDLMKSHCAVELVGRAAVALDEFDALQKEARELSERSYDLAKTTGERPFAHQRLRIIANSRTFQALERVAYVHNDNGVEVSVTDH